MEREGQRERMEKRGREKGRETKIQKRQITLKLVLQKQHLGAKAEWHTDINK